MTKPTGPIRLYRHPLSGHAHRVELLLSLLGLPFECVDVDLLKREQKSPEFLAKNPLGQVPVIEDGDVTLGDSNAILVYLASRYDESGGWYPREPVAAAEVQRFLSLAAGELAAGAAQARAIAIFKMQVDPSRAQKIAAKLFEVLDAHVAARRFLVGEGPTIADVAMYSYTLLAPEGGVSLGPYPNLRAWLARVEALPGFAPMRRLGGSAA